MATTANLQVKISADTASLKRNLLSAKTRVKDFAKQAISDVAKIGAALSAAFVGGTALAIHAINKTAQEIDLLGKTSSKLGIPVKELQKLQYIAQLSGMSTDQLNNSMQRMIRSIGEAAEGVGTAKDTFEKLGLDIEKLKKMTPVDQFLAISEAFKKITNQNDKVKAAFDIFGRDGVSIINALSSDLKKLGGKFDELGLGINNAQAGIVEAFNDAKLNISQILDNIRQKITVNVAEPFTNVIKIVENVITSMGGVEPVVLALTKVTLTSVKIILQSLSALIDALDYIVHSVNIGKIGFAKLGIEAGRFVNNLTGRKITNEQDRAAEMETLAPYMESYNRSKARLNDKSGGALIIDKMIEVIDAKLGSIKNEAGANPLNINMAEILDKAAKRLANDNKSVSASASTSGFGIITNAAGKTMTKGNVPETIKIQISADEGLTAKVVNSSLNKDKIVQVTNQNLDRERAKNVR